MLKNKFILKKRLITILYLIYFLINKNGLNSKGQPTISSITSNQNKINGPFFISNGVGGINLYKLNNSLTPISGPSNIGNIIAFSIGDSVSVSFSTSCNLYTGSGDIILIPSISTNNSSNEFIMLHSAANGFSSLYDYYTDYGSCTPVSPAPPSPQQYITNMTQLIDCDISNYNWGGLKSTYYPLSLIDNNYIYTFYVDNYGQLSLTTSSTTSTLNNNPLYIKYSPYNTANNVQLAAVLYSNTSTYSSGNNLEIYQIQQSNTPSNAFSLSSIDKIATYSLNNTQTTAYAMEWYPFSVNTDYLLLALIVQDNNSNSYVYQYTVDTSSNPTVSVSTSSSYQLSISKCNNITFSKNTNLNAFAVSNSTTLGIYTFSLDTSSTISVVNSYTRQFSATVSNTTIESSINWISFSSSVNSNDVYLSILTSYSDTLNTAINGAILNSYAVSSTPAIVSNILSNTNIPIQSNGQSNATDTVSLSLIS